ncbi:MAG: hypothetical protein KA436_02625 [Oligoflexales bacterium]|nr:hypothetical protein [Oligoflexales bacterium]
MFKTSKLTLFALIIAICSTQNGLAQNPYHLDRQQIENAKNGFSTVQSWDCGPRSVAVSLAMLGTKLEDIPQFVNSCPKSVGLPQCDETKFIKTNLAKKISSMLGIIGPISKCLARYAHGFQKKFDIHHEYKDKFESALHLIVDEMEAKRPVIVKIKKGLILHYFIIVGVDQDKEELTILNSEDASEESYSYEELELAMDMSQYRDDLANMVGMMGMMGMIMPEVGTVIRSEEVKQILSGFNLIHFSARVEEPVQNPPKKPEIESEL